MHLLVCTQYDDRTSLQAYAFVDWMVELHLIPQVPPLDQQEERTSAKLMSACMRFLLHLAVAGASLQCPEPAMYQFIQELHFDEMEEDNRGYVNFWLPYTTRCLSRPA
jgi:hypothetical protein